jgi:hypothetical protein
VIATVASTTFQAIVNPANSSPCLRSESVPASAAGVALARSGSVASVPAAMA